MHRLLDRDYLLLRKGLSLLFWNGSTGIQQRPDWGNATSDARNNPFSGGSRESPCLHWCSYSHVHSWCLDPDRLVALGNVSRSACVWIGVCTMDRMFYHGHCSTKERMAPIHISTIASRSIHRLMRIDYHLFVMATWCFRSLCQLYTSKSFHRIQHSCCHLATFGDTCHVSEWFDFWKTRGSYSFSF